MSSSFVRWLPALVAPVVVAGAVALPLTAASAAPDLAAKTPAQVLALVARARTLDGFSGTVTQHSALGLPSIPSTGAGSDSDTGSALEALTGDHTARVWVSGTTRSRVAVLDSTGERDLVRNGSTVWLWNSDEQQATRVVADGGAKAPEASATTPQQAADELLKMAGPTTATTVDTAQRVAGRDAYSLVLTPKTDATTIGSVQLAVDAATGLPLRVQVFARGASAPAFETGFTSVDFTTPAASRFDFTPPSDASVQTKHVSADAAHHAGAAPAGDRPTVVGTGWASVVEVSNASASTLSNPTVQRLTTAVDGGRVLSTPLVNVLLTDDGRVLAGAVPVSRLSALAAG